MSSVTSAWLEGDEVVPELEDREEWFAFWDKPEHGGLASGQLTRKQLTYALSKTLRQFDKKTLEAVVTELWSEFDEDKAEALGMEALMKPNLGLVDTVHMMMLWNR